MEVEKHTTKWKGDHYARSDVNQKYGTLFNAFLSILITLNASLTHNHEPIIPIYLEIGVQKAVTLLK